MSNAPLESVINSLHNLTPLNLHPAGILLDPEEGEMVNSLLTGLIEVVQSANLTFIPSSENQ